MLISSESHRESGTFELPISSWAIPAITGFVTLLAVTMVLA
jgi:hypothetical protein